MSDYNDDDENMDVEYEDPYQSDPEQDEEAGIQDIFEEAKELQRKEKFDQAVDKYKEVIEESAKLNSKQWVPKSWNNIFMIRCRQNSADTTIILASLLNSLEGISKKDAESSVKLAIEDIKSITDKELCRQSKLKLVSEIDKKTDDTLKIRTYLKMSEQYLMENALQDCKVILEKVKKLEAEGRFPPERVSDFKLELCCLEIQYLQKTNSDPEEIKAIVKNAQSLKSELNDSKVNAIIKENVGKMLVYEGEYEKAAHELMEAFKEYTSIGDPQAKSMLKYATFIGMLCKQQINPFCNVEAQVYSTHDQIRSIEHLRQAFEKRDMVGFNREVESEHIKGDPFLAPLIENLKEIMSIQNLKLILKPYERVGFDYLGKILKIKVDKVRHFIFHLIVEGEVRGQINSIEGYFEKDKGFDSYLEQEYQIVENYIKYLATTS